MTQDMLASALRPQSLDEFFGQEHLLAPGKTLRTILDTGTVPSLIFYGPPGTGKTTLASIIAKGAQKSFYKLNSTTAATADLKEVIREATSPLNPGGVLLYLDEIQYLNKKQQQTLLPFLESGEVTMIASTTENPYFYVYGAILSRCMVFEFRPIDPPTVEKALAYQLEKLQKQGIDAFDKEGEVLPYLAQGCGGDLRKATSALLLLINTAPMDGDGRLPLLVERAREILNTPMAFDRDGDAHFDILSAFHKSIRGSDPDAAVHYLARLLEGGDLISPCRRILAAASEDIGLAFPQAASIVRACVDNALYLGLPEARLPLTQAVLVLATAPKSNSVLMAIEGALSDIRAGSVGNIPPYLRDSHYSGAKKLGRGIGYQYPHDFPDHYVEQQYLPDELKSRHYYEPGPNKNEQAAWDYWQKIKKTHSK